MRSSFTKLSACVLGLSLACAVPQLLAKKKDKSEEGANDQRRAVHALNRLAFGPRPGDVQQVMAIGVDRWIDQQLHPERIADSAVEARLAQFRTLYMSPKEIAEEFPDGQMIKQVMDGKKPMPSDPARRAIFQVQIARLEQKQEEKRERNSDPAAQQIAAAPRREADPPPASESAKTMEELAAAAAADAAATGSRDAGSMNAMSPGNIEAASEMNETKPAPVDDAEARRMEERLYADLEVQKLPDLPPDPRYKKVLSLSADQQLSFADSLRGGKGQEFLDGLNPRQREILLAMNNPQGV